MGTIFAASYFQTVTLSSSAEQPATVTGTITVTSGNALYGSGDTAWSITNFGLIRSQGTGASGGHGIYLLAGGDVTNQSGGTVSGYAGGILIKGAAGTVVNGGQVIATGTSGFGVDLLAAGAITNLAGATISGNQYGIQLGRFAATVTNDGSIEGGTDAVLFRPGYANRLIVAPGASFSGKVDGGNTIDATFVSTLELTSGASPGTLSGLGSQFTNFSSIAVDANASWTLASGALGAGYTITDAGTLTNTGSLGSAVTLGANAYLSNASGATIAGGSGQYGVYGTGTGPATVVNAGRISGAPANGYGYSGIRLAGGGALTNRMTGVISGASGVKVDGTGTLVNAGTVVGTAVSGNGVYLYGGAVTNQSGGTISGADAGVLLWTGGGAVTNQSGGTISGGSDGVFIGGAINLTNQSGGAISGGGFGVYVSFAPATVTNAGMISGGTYAVRFQAGYVNRLVVDPGASFTGTVDGGNTIGAASVSTLELASGASTGTLSGLGTQFTDFAQITVDSGASWTLSGSNTIAASETLTLNGATLAVSGTLASGATVAFAGAGAYLHFDNPGSIAGSVINFADGETIDLKGVDPTTVSYSAGQLHFGSGEAFALSLAGADTVHATKSTDGAAISLLCFCANTLIQTPSGERRVQGLAAGDAVTTVCGETRRIAWIGTGKVLATRGRRNAATPVIVRRGALADNVPSRDLRVTKGHALYLDGALIPVEYLVNHRSIEWDDRAQEVELYHIELETHDVLLANGAPAESYRDDGNRWLFRNANSGWGLPPQEPCAPILTGGPVVDAAWRRLLDRAGSRPGLPLTDEPDVHLLVDGQRLDVARRHGDVHVFRLPARPARVRIVSRAAAPQELGLARDPRVLGVALRRIMLIQGRRLKLIEADDTLLADGFHAFEADNGFRWTDGDAALPASLFGDFPGAVEIELHVACTASYVAAGTERQVA